MTAQLYRLPESEIPSLYAYEIRRVRIVDEQRPQMRSPQDIVNFSRELIDADGLDQEQLGVLLLDSQNQALAAQIVYQGNLAGSSVRVGEVFRLAVIMQAASIVVIHNHPSGDVTMSGEDLRITAEFIEAGRILDIELLDHIVLASGNRWQSARALGGIGPSTSGNPLTHLGAVTQP